MLKSEFENLAGYAVSDSDYYGIIEPLYYATDLSKADFVQTLNPKRFALPTVAQDLAKLRKMAKGYALSGDIDELFALQDSAQDFAADHYQIDRRNSSEWCFINKTHHRYTGNLETVTLSLGRLGGLSFDFVLWSAKGAK